MSGAGTRAERTVMETSLRCIFACLLFLPALASVGSACTITIGPYDDTGGTAPPKTSVLPDQQGGPADEPPLDEGQQARLEETEGYTRDVIYKGGEIVAAVELPASPSTRSPMLVSALVLLDPDQSMYRPFSPLNPSYSRPEWCPPPAGP